MKRYLAAAHDHVAKKSSCVTEFSLDLINDDLRGSNLFHLSNVKLVDLLRENYGDDFEKTWNFRDADVDDDEDDENDNVINMAGENKLMDESVESSAGLESKKSDNLLNGKVSTEQDNIPLYDDEKYENEKKAAGAAATFQETKKMLQSITVVDGPSCKFVENGKLSIKSTIASNEQIEKIMELEETAAASVMLIDQNYSYEISASRGIASERTIFEHSSEIFEEINLMKDRSSSSSSPSPPPRLSSHKYLQRRSKLLTGTSGALASASGQQPILEQRPLIITSLKELLQERKILKLKNDFLNKKCSIILGKCMPALIGRRLLFESIDEAAAAGQLFLTSTLPPPPPIHLNQRYEAVLEDVMVMQTHYDNAKPILVEECEKLKNSYEALRDIFNKVFTDLMHRELIIGSNCIDGKTGKVINEEKIRSLMKKQEGKFHQLSKIRVVYFKLNNSLSLINGKLRRLNMLIMDSDRGGGGGGGGTTAHGDYHYDYPNDDDDDARMDHQLLSLKASAPSSPTLMDYEQLMMVNNCLMDKMDERDQELRKLRDKCTASISIFSHMKESWDMLTRHITSTTSKFEETSKIKEKARALLAIEGSTRDSLRKDMSRIRHHAVTGALLLLEIKPMLLKKMNIDSQTLEMFKLKVPTS